MDRMSRGGLLSTRRVQAAVVVVLVVSAAIGIYWTVKAGGPHSGFPTLIDDGPSYFEALASVNASVRSISGGPWAIFSVYGIAAQEPFSPNVLSYLSDNYTVNNCGRLFDGVTLWNGTLPIFTGTFNSGTAPFWQFAFYSNSTNEDLIATNVEGVPHVYPPEPNQANGTCYPWIAVPGTLAWSKALTRVSVDSTVAAAAAWPSVSVDWPQPSEPFVEIMSLGPSMFSRIGYVTGGYLVLFDRCGLLGVSGNQTLLGAAVNWSNPSGQAINSGLGGTNCDAPPYAVQFSQPAELHDSITSWTTIPFQLVWYFHASNGSVAPYYDPWGLANWMTSWNLTTSTGQALPPAGPGCQSWVAAVSECIANASGWYAVILSASGAWINSYGMQPGGVAGWSAPVTALVSQQQLVVVAPSSWNVTGDRMAVSPTNATLRVSGSASL